MFKQEKLEELLSKLELLISPLKLYKNILVEWKEKLT